MAQTMTLNTILSLRQKEDVGYGDSQLCQAEHGKGEYGCYADLSTCLLH